MVIKKYEEYISIKNEYKDYINLTEAFKPDFTRLYVAAISID